MYTLPDAPTGRVVVKQPKAVSPHDIGSRPGYFAHDALELDRAPRLVNLLFDNPSMVVNHFDAWN